MSQWSVDGKICDLGTLENNPLGSHEQGNNTENPSVPLSGKGCQQGEERAKGWAGQSSDVSSRSGAGGGRQQSKLGEKSRQPRASDRSVHRKEELWLAVGHGVSLFNHFGREPLPVRMRNRSVCFFPVAEMDTPAQGAYGGSKGLLTHGSKKVTSGKARCS